MKKVFTLMAVLLMLGSLNSCKKDENNSQKKQDTPAEKKTDDQSTEKKTDTDSDDTDSDDADSDDTDSDDADSDDTDSDDADSDDADSDDALTDLYSVCRKTTGNIATCITQYDISIKLLCSDGKVYIANACFENSHCTIIDNGSSASCACNDNYDLTQNEDGYYCNKRPDYPSDIANICADKADNYSSCVKSGNDSWAIYCYDKNLYANDGTGNCTKDNLTCVMKHYENGDFAECQANEVVIGECSEDADCASKVPANATYDHAGAFCANHKCIVGCEFGYSFYHDEEEIEDDSCEPLDKPCRTSSDCAKYAEGIEGASGICQSNFNCTVTCGDGYKNDWNDNEWIGCKKTSAN